MNNTGEIKHRMHSIRQTVQISGAQKLIAASHIAKSRRMLEETAPFHDRIQDHIAHVVAMSPDLDSPYLQKGSFKPKKRGVLLITSDQGLSGGYNSNLLRFAEESMALSPAQQLVVLGRIGRNHLEHKGYAMPPPLPCHIDPPTIFVAREIAEFITRLFEAGQVDCFDVIYAHFTSAAKVTPVCERLFPLGAAVFGEPSFPLREVVFEPSPGSVLSMLIPKYLKGFLYGCLVHAWSSELASRVMAMDSAIRNGNDMLDDLSLLYNRSRQAAITQEITEIVSGMHSIKKKMEFFTPHGCAD